MATFGIDIRTLENGDMDPTFTLDGGEAVLLVRLRRRLLTPRGALDFHPDDGIDVRVYLNSKIDYARLSQIKTDVENELEKDVDVVSVSAIVRYSAKTETLTIQCDIETTAGTEETLVLVLQK